VKEVYPQEDTQSSAIRTPASREGMETGFRLFSAQEQSIRSIALEKEEEEKKALINERMKLMLDARRKLVDGKDDARTDQ